MLLWLSLLSKLPIVIRKLTSTLTFKVDLQSPVGTLFSEYYMWKGQIVRRSPCNQGGDDEAGTSTC